MLVSLPFLRRRLIIKKRGMAAEVKISVPKNAARLDPVARFRRRMDVRSVAVLRLAGYLDDFAVEDVRRCCKSMVVVVVDRE